MVDLYKHPLELLSPAKNLECGLAAINHGADAVYIGGPQFGARAAAQNSLADIEQLVQHAHLFKARVYIALNTLFTDSELQKAVKLVHSYYDMGVDALIIQDMGLLECDLPPISLHASTQTDNRTADKVKFLEDAGFEQVVLARELSLKQIRGIRQETTVPLEVFIHGALCVSYSGQCYISERVAGRSANRGECAQFCRHSFTLKDREGRIVSKDRYLLSLKDLSRANSLEELVEAGVNSFKIEGRLKDVGYVKNVTAYYRQLLDNILEDRPELSASSSGTCSYSFSPDPAKTFNRGYTDYFLNQKRSRSGSIDSPKSLGEKIGMVRESGKTSFTLQSDISLANGDGLCYFNSHGILVGLKANRVDGNRVHHRQSFSPKPGTIIYRNHDVQFEKELSRSERCRFLSVDIEVVETKQGLRVTITDEDRLTSEKDYSVEKQSAEKIGIAQATIERQMQKSGDTCFKVNSVRTEVDDTLYIAAALVNDIRRNILANHERVRLATYQVHRNTFTPNSKNWLSDRVTFLDNITNKKARDFYHRHGVVHFDLSEENQNRGKDGELMRTRYCILNQMGMCLKQKGQQYNMFKPPFTLEDNTGVYELEFDCPRCEMVVRKSF